MIVEYIRYAMPQHSPAALKEAYALAGDSLRASPECQSYELSQCCDDPKSVVVRIV